MVEAFKSRHTKLTLTWYNGKNQTLLLQGKDSPALKVKLINLVHIKDPSSAQSDSSPLSEEVGVQKDLPPDIITTTLKMC